MSKKLHIKQPTPTALHVLIPSPSPTCKITPELIKLLTNLACNGPGARTARALMIDAMKAQGKW